MTRKKQLPKKAMLHFSTQFKTGVLVFLAFFTGLFSGSFVDMQKFISWANSKLYLEDVVGVNQQIARRVPQLPKPKLEFYTLLTSNHNNGKVPAPDTAVTQHLRSTENVKIAQVEEKGKVVVNHTANAIHPNVIDVKTRLASNNANSAAEVKSIGTKNPNLIKSTYNIQVAAFRARRDADQLKASLLLKGIDSSIQAINAQNVTWFRVTIGPFATREQAEKMQMMLSNRERVSGMIRKMDA